ncbi:MAG: hypothetical protein ABTQ31_06270 [Rhizobiaceae bacterium]
MHVIVMWMGGITAAIGLLFFVLTVATSGQTAGPFAALYAVIIGGSLILSGAMLYCFGAIVKHLRDIKALQQQQLAIFDRLGRPRA